MDDTNKRDDTMSLKGAIGRKKIQLMLDALDEKAENFSSWDLERCLKEYEDLQLHILIPQYQGNYFNLLVMVSSLVPFTKSNVDDGRSRRAFSSYDNFAVQHSNIIPMQLDEMKDSELQSLLKIAFKEQNNGDFEPCSCKR